jgi:hypothetical protein
MFPWHLEFILLRSRTINVFTHQRNTNIHVLCKLHRGFTAVKSWCVRWNVKINEGKIHTIYLFRKFGVPKNVLQLNGRDIPFVSNVTFLGVTCCRRMTWRYHIWRTAVKALCMYIQTYFIFESMSLNTNIKITLYKALIRSYLRLPPPPGGMWWRLTSWNFSACRTE